MPAVISVENLSKSYRLGLIGSASLREDVSRWWAMLRGRPDPLLRIGQPHDTRSEGGIFWALHNLTFQVRQGEVLGVIGRNGAGKSTLLKILSRVTGPTEGQIRLRGRVASLLEVGTGFHQELTGRENVFLNGAILGMTKAEIRAKFDEIVAFSEIGEFIDTPVKRYSSGMYVRLAFAVAAHLEPEILIVDEVLAVGDAVFQKKCLGKMQDVAGHGRTVLFVSHNMAAVRGLCSRSIVLDGGAILFDGESDAAVSVYSSGLGAAFGEEWVRQGARPDSPMCFERVRASVTGKQPGLTLQCELEIDCNQSCPSAFVAVDIADASGTVIMQALPSPQGFMEGRPGRHFVRLAIALPPLIPGHYSVLPWVGPHNSRTWDLIKRGTSFEITTSPTPGRTHPHNHDHGWMVPPSGCEYRPPGRQDGDAPKVIRSSLSRPSASGDAS
jgi:lipopolysaccharide transport system ATP-binding protein